MGVETVWLETIDGIEVEADIVRTDAPVVRATVVIGHPHPLYGGDRHNHVVAAIQRAAARLDCHSVAVDFRGVGNSGGLHDDGDSERLDLMAACELADMMNPDGSIIMAGYSFGSVVALNVSHPMIHGWLAVAPPVAMLTSDPVATRHAAPKILLAPEHDQFTAPEELRTRVAEWQGTSVVDLPGVDHMIAVGAETAAHDALAALLSQTP